MDGMPPDAAARRPDRPAHLLDFSPDPLAPPSPELRVSARALWLAALGGPVSWAIHLVVMYPLVEAACRYRTEVPLYATSALLCATAALSGLASRIYLRRARDADGTTGARRVRFMATAGFLGAVLFMIVIAGETLPVLFDDPCQLPGRRRSTLVPFL